MTKARDISKLSAVEVNATADQTDAEVKAAVEAASDSNTFTDADHSKLNAIEASADVTDATNVTAAGALMDSELTNLAAVKAINQSLVTTAGPTFSAVTTTGNVIIGDSDSDNAHANADNLVIGTTSGSNGMTIVSPTDGTGSIHWSDGTSSGNANIQGQLIYAHNDNSMRFYTAVTERMRIDSSGRVGIANDTPSDFHANADDLVIGNSSGNRGITIRASSSGSGNIFFADGTSGSELYKGIIQYKHDTDQLVLGAGSNDVIFMNSSKNVAIGSSNPNSRLRIQKDGTGEYSNITIDNANSTGAISFGVGGSGVGNVLANNAFLMNQGNSSLIFGTNDTERMRLDSSGNLLVGTTSNSVYNDSSGTGIALNAGQIQIAGTGTPLYANRQGSDGGIIDFRKDGSTVGSIGTTGGDLYIATGDTGIRFDDSADQIRASTSAGSNRDGAIDIGFTDSRFKDLYLSGGVYLGGTGSDNKLEDYEEGSWTPTLGASGGASGQGYAHRVGSYTKIGNKVTANWRIVLNAKGTLTGTTRISGLPFNGNASPIYNVASTMVGLIYLDDDENFKAMQYAANAFLYLMKEKDDTNLVQISGNGNFDNDSEISGSVTYFTNS